VSAFSSVVNPNNGISFTSASSSFPSRALVLSQGSYLSSPLLPTLTVGSSSFTISSWVKCNASSYTDENPSGVVVAWGAPQSSSSTSTLTAATLAVTGAERGQAEVSTLAGSGSQYWADGFGVYAGFNYPYGMAIDTFGFLYVADMNSNRIRYVSPLGEVSTLAGVTNPYGIAVDPNRNVYVTSSRAIFKVSQSGSVSYFAGGFNNPQGLAVDSAFNVYVADAFDHLILKITPTGSVSVLAGSGTVSSDFENYGGHADGFGTNARFGRPYGVAVDSSGFVYVADTYNGKLRKITPSGNVTTLNGPGGWALALDSYGNIYQLDHGPYHRVAVTTPSGYVFTLAGGTGSGFADGSGTNAKFNVPYGIAVNHLSGIVYVAEFSNHRIRKLQIPIFLKQSGVVPVCDNTWHHVALTYSGSDSSNSITSFIDGSILMSSLATYSISSTTSTSTLRIGWNGLNDGNYEAFSGLLSDIRVFSRSLSLNEVTNISQPFLNPYPNAINPVPLANSFSYLWQCLPGFFGRTLTLSRSLLNGSWFFSGGPVNCQACGAFQYSYGSLSCSSCSNGTFLVSSSLGCQPTYNTSRVPTDTSFYFSGSDTEGVSAFSSIVNPNNGISFTSSASSFPNKALVLSQGSYLSSPLLPTLPVGSSSFTISTWVKCNASSYTDENPSGVVVAWGAPQSSSSTSTLTAATLAVTSADRVKYNIGIVSTLAGGTSQGFADGRGSEAQFNYPYGLAVNGSGVVFVADSNNNRIRMILPDGTVSSLAGQAAAGTTDGIGADSRFNKPFGIVIDSMGSLFVSDSENNRVRKVIIDTGNVTTITGSDEGFTDGSFAEAKFNRPEGLVFDNFGNLFVADQRNNRIRNVSFSTGSVSTFASAVSNPSAIAFDATYQFLYVADGNFQVRRISMTGNVNLVNEYFDRPSGISLFSSRNIIVSNGGITQITPSGSITWITRNLRNLIGIAIDKSDNLYVSDFYNRILKITLSPSLPGPLPICDAIWHHVALSYSGSTSNNMLSAFIDGKNVTSTSAVYSVLSSSHANLRLGWNGSSEYFSGSISDVRIFNRSLSTSEVLSLIGSADSGITDSGVLASAAPSPTASATRSPSSTTSVTTSISSIATSTASSSPTLTTTTSSTPTSSASLTPTSTVTSSPLFSRTTSSTQSSTASSSSSSTAIVNLTLIATATSAASASASASSMSTFTSAASASASTSSMMTLTAPASQSPTASSTASSSPSFSSSFSALPTFSSSSTSSATSSVTSTTSVTVTPSGLPTSSATKAPIQPCSAGSFSSSGSSPCTPCPINTYSYSGASSCSACPTDFSILISSSLGCRPSAVSIGPTDTSFYHSGSQIEGISAFSSLSSNVSGISFYVNKSVYPSEALKISSKSCLSTALLPSLPTGSSPFTISSWVKCNVSDSKPSETVFTWGVPGSSSSLTSATLAVTKFSDFSSFSEAKVTTVAGVDGGNISIGGSYLRFYPEAIIADTLGNVFMIDSANDYSFMQISKISPSGFISTLAVFSKIRQTLAIDNAGNLLTVDDDNKILKITQQGVVSTFLPNIFSLIIGIAVDNDSGNLYITEGPMSIIKKVTPSGNLISQFGVGIAGWADGSYTQAQFNYPQAVAIDSTSGNVYVPDADNHRIRRIDKDGYVSTFAGSGNASFADGIGTNAMLNFPIGVCIDSRGNIYVADSGNGRIRRITSTGIVKTLAGGAHVNYNYYFSYGGFADGFGTSAMLNNPRGVTLDSKGALYVADTSNFRIRKILIALPLPGPIPSCDNTWHHISLSYSGSSLNNTLIAYIDGKDIGSSTVMLSIPSSLSESTLRVGCNTESDEYFTGSVTDIRVFSRALTSSEIVILSQPLRESDNKPGAISPWPPLAESTLYTWYCQGGFYGPIVSLRRSTYDGSWITSGTVDCKPCEDKKYSYVGALLCSSCSSDSTFISSSLGCRLTSTNRGPTDTSFYFSGSDTEGVSAFSSVVNPNNGISFTSSASSFPNKALVLSQGSYLSSPLLPTLPVGSSSFTISTWVKCNASSYTDENPSGVVVAWGAPQSSSSTSTLTAATLAVTSTSIMRGLTTVNSFAGSGSNGFTDGIGVAASFYTPSGIAIDSLSGSIYVADSNNRRIRKVSMSSGVVTTLAGNGVSGFSDGQGVNARFNNPQGVVFDSTRNIVYVADTNNNRIRTISASGVVSTLAGSGIQGFADGSGVNANFYRPFGIAVDLATGTIFVSDRYNHRIRKITLSGIVSTVAGGASASFSDGSGTSARFNYPQGIALDSSGEYLYVADSDNQRIRKITISSGLVKTIAGRGTVGDTDGLGIDASFSAPSGIALDGVGNLFVTDFNNLIRKIDVLSGFVSTVAGISGVADFLDGASTTAMFNSPQGIAIDSAGTLFIADSNNHRIRKVITTPSLPGPLPVCDSTYHHITLSYSNTFSTAIRRLSTSSSTSSSGALTAYIDGLKYASVLVNVSISSSGSSTFRIGTNGLDNKELFSGSLSDLRIFNRALNESEIQSLKAQPLSNPVLPTTQETGLLSSSTLYTIIGSVAAALILSGGGFYLFYFFKRRKLIQEEEDRVFTIKDDTTSKEMIVEVIDNDSITDSDPKRSWKVLTSTPPSNISSTSISIASSRVTAFEDKRDGIESSPRSVSKSVGDQRSESTKKSLNSNKEDDDDDLILATRREFPEDNDDDDALLPGALNKIKDGEAEELLEEYNLEGLINGGGDEGDGGTVGSILTAAGSALEGLAVASISIPLVGVALKGLSILCNQVEAFSQSNLEAEKLMGRLLRLQTVVQKAAIDVDFCNDHSGIFDYMVKTLNKAADKLEMISKRSKFGKFISAQGDIEIIERCDRAIMMHLAEIQAAMQAHTMSMVKVMHNDLLDRSSKEEEVKAPPLPPFSMRFKQSDILFDPPLEKQLINAPRGSFGVVVFGIWKAHNLPCAVKLISSRTATGVVAVSMMSWLSEAELMRRLREHLNSVTKQTPQNICTLFGIGAIESPKTGEVTQYMVVMERLEGSLRDKLDSYLKKKRHPPLVQALTWIRDVAMGISECHDANVVHSDLKAANALLSKKNEAKLCDLGAGRVTRDMTATASMMNSTGGGIIRGSLPWLSSELLEDQSLQPSKASDVYAWACVCWEILTCRIPYHDEEGVLSIDLNKLKNLSSIVNGKLRPDLSALRADAPSSIVEMMKRAWDPEPRDRPLIGEILETLESALSSFKDAKKGDSRRAAEAAAADLRSSALLKQASKAEEEDAKKAVEDLKALTKSLEEDRAVRIALIKKKHDEAAKQMRAELEVEEKRLEEESRREMSLEMEKNEAMLAQRKSKWISEVKEKKEERLRNAHLLNEKDRARIVAEFELESREVEKRVEASRVEQTKRLEARLRERKEAKAKATQKALLKLDADADKAVEEEKKKNVHDFLLD
jgi:DNA-binding beta-propeller fold protein YncE